MGRGPAWTDSEIACAASLRRHLSRAEIAARLGRSPESIHEALRRRGLVGRAYERAVPADIDPGREARIARYAEAAQARRAIPYQERV